MAIWSAGVDRAGTLKHGSSVPLQENTRKPETVTLQRFLDSGWAPLRFKLHSCPVELRMQESPFSSILFAVCGHFE